MNNQQYGEENWHEVSDNDGWGDEQEDEGTMDWEKNYTPPTRQIS